MILSNAAINNRVTVLVLVLLIVVAGVWAYLTLPREAAPDVPIPIIMISTVYEGVSPADVETSITMKIEQELTGLKGLEEVRSTSREGISLIVAEFQPDIDIEDALQRVRDKVEQARVELPQEAEEPLISEVNVADFPIMMISISGPISPIRLKVIAEELEDVIESQPGVLEVDVLGALEREIRLEFDPDRLAAYQISIPELIALIPGENVNVSAGGLSTEGTKFSVRVPAEFVEPEEVNRLPLVYRDGRPIYLTDVASVVDTFKDRDTYARMDGEPSITITVKKRTGANIVEIAERVKAIMAAAQEQMPAGVKLELTLDESKDIYMMVADLENNILSALVLVVAVLMLAMGLRTALVVGLAIPLSMLMSVAALQAMGITLNMIVLFSLVLALGMLVDNAIVIVENIYRYMQEGYARLEAARKATAEVAWPVISSTATTIAAFAPLLLWEGIVGEFMKYLPITVIVVLTSSLFVALVVSPVAASLFTGQARQKQHRHPLQAGYRGILRLALRHWAATLLLALIALAAVGVLFGKYSEGVRFFPDLDPKRALVTIRLPQGTNVERTDMVARLVEARIEPLRYGPDGEVWIEHILANVGSAGDSRGFGDNASGPHIANITLVFPDYEVRSRPSKKILEYIRRALADVPGAEIQVAEEEGGPPTGAPVTVRIAGEDFATLERLADDAMGRIVSVPGLINLREDYEGSRPELQFIPDRDRVLKQGVSTALIGQFLKTSVFGMKVSTYRQFNDEYDITVRLPLDRRQAIEDLLTLRVPDAGGNPIPLSSLGTFVYRGGKGDINRVDQDRVITLTADIEEGRQPDVVLREVQQLLTPAGGGGLELPEGYTVSYVGEKEEQDKAAAFLGRAYLIAILAITMILVMQFNRLSVPFIIMFTVLLSLIGVLTGLLVTQTPFVIIMTGIGVVSLAGVVVNNAIVLLDYTQQLRAQGLGLYEAVLQAGQTRLRPVLLTAVTTILSLVPMATGLAFDFHKLAWTTRSESSLWWAPMANAVIYGLGFATLLTLVVVPSMYYGLYHTLGRIRRAGERRGVVRPRGGGEVEPAVATVPALPTSLPVDEPADSLPVAQTIPLAERDG